MYTWILARVEISSTCFFLDCIAIELIFFTYPHVSLGYIYIYIDRLRRAPPPIFFVCGVCSASSACSACDVCGACRACSARGARGVLGACGVCDALGAWGCNYWLALSGPAGPLVGPYGLISSLLVGPYGLISWLLESPPGP